MKTHVLRNATRDVVVATSVVRATNPVARAVGLLGRRAVAPYEGLWLGRCSAVHTVGMRATLDLYFLDAENRVLKIEAAVAPQRFAVACRYAATVVELGANPNGPPETALGDTLVLE